MKTFWLRIPCTSLYIVYYYNSNQLYNVYSASLIHLRMLSSFFRMTDCCKKIYNINPITGLLKGEKNKNLLKMYLTP